MDTRQRHHTCRDRVPPAHARRAPALADPPSSRHYCIPVTPTPRSRWRAIVSDIHFWIPVAVLLVGLLVLRWIA